MSGEKIGSHLVWIIELAHGLGWVQRTPNEDILGSLLYGLALRRRWLRPWEGVVDEGVSVAVTISYSKTTSNRCEPHHVHTGLKDAKVIDGPKGNDINQVSSNDIGSKETNWRILTARRSHAGDKDIITFGVSNLRK